MLIEEFLTGDGADPQTLIISTLFLEYRPQTPAGLGKRLWCDNARVAWYITTNERGIPCFVSDLEKKSEEIDAPEDGGRPLIFPPPISDEQRLPFLTGILGFLHCHNVELDKREIEPGVNAKRERKGKSPLLPYYECIIDGMSTLGPASGGKGSGPSFRFDVRGHIRRIPTEEDPNRTTWVRPHQRGLKHALYKPKTYNADKKALPVDFND
jgi:hypothetical protein